MDSPKVIARATALVCLAALAVGPPNGLGWAASTVNLQQQQQQQHATNTATQVRHTQDGAPNQGQSPIGWVFPGGAAHANTQLTKPVAEAVVANSDRIRRQAATPNQKKKKQPSKNKNKGGFKRQLAECLEAHNKWRRLHQVPDLEWDDKLAAFAQKRSDHIAASDGDEFGHPPNLPFGENLFWHSSLDTSCDYMVKGWYDEIGLYDYKAPSFAPATGHFTQMVWRTTKKVGCAFTPSTGPRGGLYLTCNYDPAGNWLGEFEENVPLPVSVPDRSQSAARGAKPPTGLAATSSTTSTTTTTTTTTTARPATAVTSSAASTTTLPLAGEATTKPKSKKKKNKKKQNKKKGDKDKKKDKKKGNKKKKGGKKKTTTTTTTTTATPATNTTKAPGLISS